MEEFAQNWMTNKTLAGPEWENPRYRDQHAEKSPERSLISLLSSMPMILPTRRRRVTWPLRRSIPSASLSIVNKTVRANG